MKVSIQNLGAVKQAEIEIKPLTVFVGENGTGKTWAAYALAGILGRVGYSNFTVSYLHQKLANPPEFPEIEQAVQQVIEEGTARIDVVEFAEKYLLVFLNAIAVHARQWLPAFLGTPQSDFSELRFVFKELSMSLAIGTLMDLPLRQGWAVGKDNEPKLSLLKSRGERYLYIVTTSSDVQSIMPVSAFRENIIQQVFLLLHWSVDSNAVSFVVERTALPTLLPNTPDFLQRMDVFANPWSEGMAVPTQNDSTFVLSSTLQLVSEGKDAIALQQEDRQSYVRLSQLLEEDVLLGRVSYKQVPMTNYWELYYDFGKGHPLELRAASSMVKQLALLVLYLRYLAQKNDVIVIDEPEMNLHPEAQARMTEFLCMLVNAGLNVIVTTHSSYIVDHLANLLKAAKSSDKAELAERFFLKDERAFIAQDKVSVYQFEDGSAHSILDEDGYIDWQTFSDVSERMLRLADIVEDYQGAVV